MSSLFGIKETITTIPTIHQLCLQVLNDDYTPSTKASSLANQQTAYSASSNIYSRSLVWKLCSTKLDNNSSEIGINSTSTTADYPLIKLLEINLINLKYERKQYHQLINDFKIPWFELKEDNKFYQKFKIDEQELDITDVRELPTANSLHHHSPTKFSRKRGHGKSSLNSISVSNDPLYSNSRNLPSTTSTARATATTNNKTYQINPELTKHTSKETDLQILESIINDVERLFPENEDLFINNFQNQINLIEIIYLWIKYTSISYHQGLHEIFGMIYITLLEDSIDEDEEEAVTSNSNHKQNQNAIDDSLDANIIELMNKKYLKHDCFILIQKLIYGILERYYVEDNLISEFIKFELKFKLIDSVTYNILKKRLDINFNIWLIRYFKLLLTREIGLENSLNLWDKLIAFNHLNKLAQWSSYSASSPTSSLMKTSGGRARSGSTSTPNEQKSIGQIDICLLIPYLTVLLISKIKERLVVSDYSEALFILLHYPIKEPPPISARSPLHLSSKLNLDSRTMTQISSRKTRKFHPPVLLLSSSSDNDEEHKNEIESLDGLGLGGASSEVEDGFVYVESANPNHVQSLHSALMSSESIITSPSNPHYQNNDSNTGTGLRLSNSSARRLPIPSPRLSVETAATATSEESDDADLEELIDLNISEMCLTAIRLFYMNDKELETYGLKLVDSFANSRDTKSKKKQHKQSTTNTLKHKDSESAIGMLKRTASWSLTKKKTTKSNKLTLDFFIDPASIRPLLHTTTSVGVIGKTTATIQIGDRSPTKKDYNRTRLEKRLQKIVN